MRGKLPTVSGILVFEDGREVPIEDLTPEENAQWRSNMNKRLSEGLSRYYSLHPDEFELL